MVIDEYMNQFNYRICLSTFQSTMIEKFIESLNNISLAIIMMSRYEVEM